MRPRLPRSDSAWQQSPTTDSQMIVGVVGRSDGKIENAMNVAGERAKGYVLKRMLDLGSSPYLNNYRWKKDDEVKVSDSKVGKGR